MNIIYHHLGLGDHIVCNGLVRKIVNNNETFGLFVKKHNVDNVLFMYKDLKKLKLIPIDGDSNVSDFYNENIISIGHQKLGTVMSENNCFWDEAFYKQMNIDFKERWTSFYYARDFNTEKITYNKFNPNEEEFILIHNIDSTGTDRIDYSKVSEKYKKIFIEKSNTIFDYGLLIAKAKEIHCVDSSFKHLVDSIPSMGKLFYHKNYKLKISLEHNHKKNWIII
jgi:hypothetical protein